MKQLNTLALLFFILVVSPVLEAAPFIEGMTLSKQDVTPFRAPTLRQMQYEGTNNIQWTLQMKGLPTKYWDFWNQIVKGEERGVFGYHSAKQKVRIFQDIVKIIFEEVLEFEIKKDFHFFRVPLDPLVDEYANAKEFLYYFPDIHDDIPQHRNQIVSLNYTLFGNYQGDGSQSTVFYFSNNISWFNVTYENKLLFLFNELGIPPQEIANLFLIGKPIEQFSSGVLYQFTDTSHHDPHNHNAYEFADTFAYPSLAAGPFDYHVTVPLSDLFQATHPKKFDSYTGQIRLVMNTSGTVNPYSSFSIRRYDLIDAVTVKSYETALREKIRQLPRDQQKVESYKQKVKAYWYVKD